MLQTAVRVIRGKQPAQRQHRRKQRRHPHHPRPHEAQGIHLRPNPEGKQAHHDHEKKQGGEHVCATPHRQRQVAHHHTLQGRPHARAAHSPRCTWRARREVISTSWWVVSITIPPLSRCSPNSVCTRPTDLTSRALKGSSNIHKVLSSNNNLARARRRRCPCDSALPGSSVQASSSMRCSASKARSSLAATPRMRPLTRRFSKAVSASLMPLRWPIYIMRPRYSSPSRRISVPFQRTSPAAGKASPHRVRNNVVLPLPLAPCTKSSSPVCSAKFKPLNRRRSPRSQARSTTTNKKKTDPSQ